MRIGQSWYPPVTKMPAKKPFIKYALGAVACFAVFAGWGIMFASRV